MAEVCGECGEGEDVEDGEKRGDGGSALSGEDVADVQFFVDFLEPEFGFWVRITHGVVFEVQFPVQFAVDDLDLVRWKVSEVREGVVW